MVGPFLQRIGVVPLSLAMTLGIAGLAGLAARAAHLPMGLLLGALSVTAAIAITGLRPFGRSLNLPTWLRSGFVPVIGVGTGGAFTPEVVAQIPDWLPSLALLLLFIPVVHLMGFAVYRAGGLPRAEAFFGAAPGGLLETVELARQSGADEAMVTVLQFLRLIVTIIAVPLVFWALTGQAVGSSSGAALPAAKIPLGPVDVLVLVAAGAAGYWTASRLRLPAAQMVGPLVFSALAHGFGLVEGVPPLWLVGVTQVVLGAGLGVRFVGADHAMLRRAGSLAVVSTGLALLAAAAAGFALHYWVDQPVTAVFLAYAPGGLAEMTLIALSLQASVAFVTVHHVLRILIAVLGAKAGARLLRAR